MKLSKPSLLILIPIAAFALAFPLMAPNTYVINIVNIGLTYAIMAASWDLLYGYAGQLSFGYAGFFGVGAYTSALLSFWLGISPWFGLLLGGLGAAVFGAIVGIPSLRLKGVYLALSTLAFTEVARVIITNWHSVTRGTLGFSAHPTYPGLPFTRLHYYYLILLLAVLCIGFMYWLGNHTRTGLVLRAIRSDDIRSQALGVDILRYKVLAFALSAFFAGVAGAYFAHYLRVITPGELSPTITIFIIAYATIGGIGTIIGPAVAAVVIHFLIEYLRIFGAVYNLMAVGAMLIVFVIFLPDGMAGLLQRLKGAPRRSPASSGD
jgi:branched-chain amino acid transport system permease protein